MKKFYKLLLEARTPNYSFIEVINSWPELLIIVLLKLLNELENFKR